MSDAVGRPTERKKMSETEQRQVRKAWWRRLHNKMLWWGWYRWTEGDGDTAKEWRW